MDQRVTKRDDQEDDKNLIIERHYEPDDEAIDRARAILLRDDVDHVARENSGGSTPTVG